VVEYVVAGILIGILAIASVFALVVGLLGAFGGLSLGRCAGCGHIAVSRGEPRTSCAYCRHPHLAQPLAAWPRHARPRS
jgi:hypothetical protein